MTKNREILISRTKLRVLYAIIIILALTVVGLVIFRQTTAAEKDKYFQEGEQLRVELDDLMENYTTVKTENAELSSQMQTKDSIIMANANEIKKLIATQADYYKIKKKLKLLREITQDYVQRIDSLVVANTELKTENLQIKQEINRERNKNVELEEARTQLENKMTEAAVYRLFNFDVNTVRVRSDLKEVPTDKSKRLDRINVSFYLGGNKLIEAGKKTVYVRVARPDGVILTLGEDDVYSFELDGERLQYSMKKEIDYKQEDMRVDLKWDKLTSGSAMPGRYEVTVYIDGQTVGSSSCVVRE